MKEDITQFMLYNTLIQHRSDNGSIWWPLLSIITIQLVHYLSKYDYRAKLYNIKSEVMHLFQHKYSYTVEGTCWNSISSNFGEHSINHNMSNTFFALISYFNNKFPHKDRFHNLYVYNISRNKNRNLDEIDKIMEKTRSNQTIPEQTTPICINDKLQIYCTIDVLKYEKDGNNGVKNASVEVLKIIITLYSYVSNAALIKTFVDKITNDYLEQIELSRVGKQYIYTMLSVKGNTEHEDNDDVEEKDICKNGIVWNETIFETVKSFDNVYFRNKTEIMDKIHFFLNNKDWYYQHGIPYTLGIGLHGPPGTGKTSFIKALARHTGRHIVCISMKVVTTRNQLQSVFYETRYNMNNSYIGFKDKIIVFEDIDCTGNIVLDREYQKPEDIVSDSTKDNLVDNEFECGGVVERKPKGWNEIQKDKALTLDDILNMWDGIRETPGRILIITSNFYNRLDKALIRPGRIDIEVETTVEDAATFKNTLSLKN